jgi:hypothetical protein
MSKKKAKGVFKTVKANIPFQGIMDPADKYHVYEVYPDGKSTLLAVCKYKKLADHIKNYLEEGRK